MKPTRIFMILATGIALIGVVAFIAQPEPLKRWLDAEVFKLTYQFLLIVVIGGAISLLYKQLETERTQREAERNLRRELHTDLVRAYHSAKKIRRLLRAKATEGIPSDPTAVIHAAPYNEQMLPIIDTQLDFEFFVHRVRSNPALFSGAPSIEENLRHVENYLSLIVTEYEGSLRHFPSHSGSVRLSSFPRLQDFIGPYDATSFKSDFKAPFLNAIAELETLITTA